MVLKFSSMVSNWGKRFFELTRMVVKGHASLESKETYLKQSNSMYTLWTFWRHNNWHEIRQKKRDKNKKISSITLTKSFSHALSMWLFNNNFLISSLLIGFIRHSSISAFKAATFSSLFTAQPTIGALQFGFVPKNSYSLLAHSYPSIIGILQSSIIILKGEHA